MRTKAYGTNENGVVRATYREATFQCIKIARPRILVCVTYIVDNFMKNVLEFVDHCHDAR